MYDTANQRLHTTPAVHHDRCPPSSLSPTSVIPPLTSLVVTISSTNSSQVPGEPDCGLSSELGNESSLAPRGIEKLKDNDIHWSATIKVSTGAIGALRCAQPWWWWRQQRRCPGEPSRTNGILS